MDKIEAWIKAHPIAAGAIGVGSLIVLYLLFFSGSSAPVDNTAANLQAALAAQAQSGNALAALQTQLQAASNSNQTEAAINGQNDSTAVTLATLGAQTSQNKDTLDASVALAAAGAQVQVAGINADASVAASTIAEQINANNNSALSFQSILNTIKTALTGKPFQDLMTQSLATGGAPNITVSGAFGGAPFTVQVEESHGGVTSIIDQAVSEGSLTPMEGINLFNPPGSHTGPVGPVLSVPPDILLPKAAA